MSYVKLFKVVSDFPLGFQTLNQGLDNNAALYAQLDLRHSVLGATTGPWNGMLEPGRHDDALIARTAADFYIDASTPTTWAFSLITGPMIYNSPTRLGVGQWKVYMNTSQIVGAVACVKGASSQARQATCLMQLASGRPYVIVSTWNMAAGALADYGFSLVVWSHTTV